MDSMLNPVPPPIWGIVSARRSGIGKEATYIDPNALVGVSLARIVIDVLGVELSDNQRKHVLAAAEENLAGGIVSSSLLRVEALKGVLLGGLRIAMGLQEGGVEEEEERADDARSLIIVLGLASKGEEASTAENSYSYSSIEGFNVEICAKRQNVTTL